MAIRFGNEDEDFGAGMPMMMAQKASASTPAHRIPVSSSGPTFAQEVTFISGLNPDGTLSDESFSGFNEGSAFKWGSSTAGTGATIGYTFDVDSAFTAQEKATFVKALAIWSAIADVTFTLSTTIRGITLVRGETNSGAFANTPQTIGSGSSLGSVTGQSMINMETSAAGFDLSGSFEVAGGYGLSTIIHEIGHAIGLGHSGNYNGKVDPATQQYSAFDDGQYSIMSYLSWINGTAKYRAANPFPGTNWGSSPDGAMREAPHTAMMADIEAIQQLYGTSKTATFAGGQTYGFNTTVTGVLREFFDFTANTAPIVTLYNKGLGNVLDLSGYTQAATVSLEPGTFSSAGGLVNNIAIALGTVIGTVIGGSGADTLVGSGLGDVLNGGTGADTMSGGLGSDTYVTDGGDRIIEAANAGTDLVRSSAGHTLSANVENLTLTGTAAINGFGNALANVITGNAAANVLNGLVGADTMIGGAGSDTYYVDDVGDRAIEANGAAGTDRVYAAVSYALGGSELETLILTGTANLNGTGNSLANVLTGNSGDNVLNGLGGADTMSGGTGSDTYYVDNVGDRAIEANGAAGTDLVYATVTYALAGSELENLTLTGAGAIDGTGNSLANVLTGNAAANVLDGLTGADTMIGGGGSDTYYVDDAGDRAIELNGAAGTDLVYASVSYSLGGSALENLTLTGTASLNGTGNSLANVLTGNAAANVLNGLVGADTMIGGLGNDAYGVDDIGDRVIEAAGGGTDRVLTSVTYTLAAGQEIERLETASTAGTTAIGLTGNAFHNVLVGNAGANALDGGAGFDEASYAAAAGAVTVDLAAGTASGAAGSDTLRAIEAVRGSAFADTLTGDAFVNQLAGGLGNDTLNGGAGSDFADYSAATGAVSVNLAAGTATGADGNDVLIGIEGVQGSRFADTITGSTGFNQLSYAAALGAVAVNLATGRASGAMGADTFTSIEGVVGSAFADTLTGNAVANVLTGLTGDDRLDGGAGDDVASYHLALAAVSVNLAAGTSSGADGNDTLVGIESVQGSAFADTLTGDAGLNTVWYGEATGAVTVDLATGLSSGAAGADILVGFERVAGSIFGDTLSGDAGANYLTGLAGNDILDGRDGLDFALYFNAVGAVTVSLAAGTSSGADGTDTLRNIEGLVGSSFGDVLTGDAGANILDGLTGNDSLDGGGGFDFAEYEVAAGGVTVNLATGTAAGADGADTLVRIEGVTGSAFADTLTGDGAGNLLDGRGGADLLVGGFGNDAFSFTAALGAGNVDRIADFAANEFDLIYLEKDVFTMLTTASGTQPGALSAGMFVIGSQAVDADDRILYDGATGGLAYDADGSGALAAVQFAILENRAALSADVIFVV
ncbi:M10 family metallopeptidase [Methylobacterium sp. Leaf108]|uniref:beta strand repeat-containing protein n=1 Tax=Methylobacterium sp. Leaf108 TaxID=1736256 RepID=UPI0007002D55|nr:M10 family metallopeptidase [Methylobacterium sp. Leaf108]KQP55130.1 hypothetical protein ASF39_05250 [Methylobacterium sp. Leaf108]